MSLFIILLLLCFFLLAQRLFAALKEAGLSKVDEAQFMEKIDKNHTERIELNEFIEWCVNRR